MDQDNVAMLTNLLKGRGAALYEFGIPIYAADASTPKLAVTCTEPWGTCPFSGGLNPLTVSMSPHTGSDMAMVVVDWSTRKSYEYWQYKWNNGAPTSS